MKNLLFLIIFCGLLSFVSVSQAGLTNTANDSFIDDATGLEWIDFGITNNMSFNDVEAQLDSTYSGWRLPTYDEVKALWSGIFDQPGWGWAQDGTGEDYLTDSINGETPWLSLVRDVIGYNVTNTENTKFNITGLFDTGDTQLGNVSVVAFEADAGFFGANAQLHYAGNASQHKRTTASASQSTMLVKDAAVDTNLPKTGQTTCYDENGNVISCTGTGQDGDVQSGAAWPEPRFADNGDGTITDDLTGLMWSQNANLPAAAMPWQAALDYVADMNAGNAPNLNHTDWRLPNINEIDSLVNAEERVSATWLNSQGFTDAQENAYWSSSTMTGIDTHIAFLADISTSWGYHSDLKTSNYYVWPVRSGSSGGAVSLPQTGQTTCYDESGNVIDCANTGQDGDVLAGVAWPSPRFTDNGDSTVTDNLTGLIWPQDANIPNIGLNWQGALDYVADMNSGTNQNLGYTDWRLPNREELLSLLDRSQNDPAIPLGHPFTDVQASSNYVWSSTSWARNAVYKWMVDMQNGYIYPAISTSQKYTVWPVRTGSIPDTCPNDADGDGVCDDVDNCPDSSNADQLDSDGDGQGDACDKDDDNDGVLDTEDNCSLISNPDQTDTDKDGQGDACDTDDDGDGVEDTTDNCPLTSNADQADADGDGQGDACDDDDNDGILDIVDNCPGVYNPDQLDSDGDGVGDACDECDFDAAKTVSGDCGCGTAETDSDGDGVPDCNDNSPDNSNSDQTDTDGDGIGDASDNCPDVANSDQADIDNDGTGDACDTVTQGNSNNNSNSSNPNDDSTEDLEAQVADLETTVGSLQDQINAISNSLGSITHPWTDNVTNLSTEVSIQFGDEDDVDCDSTTAGTIRFTGRDFQGCNGTVWEVLNTTSVATCYMDADGDGYGDINTYIEGCDITENVGYIYAAWQDFDCDDTDPGINPGEYDIPMDNIDQNCDGLDNDDTRLRYHIGDTGPAGGIVFDTFDDGLHGLEAAPEDQSEATWGCVGTAIAGADGVILGTGAQNTADILAGCSEAGTAAEITDAYTLGGYDDWFLPSQDELNELYQQKDLVGGFASDLYWSSTESNWSVFPEDWYAWNLDFSDGYQYTEQKHYTVRVRAIRAF